MAVAAPGAPGVRGGLGRRAERDRLRQTLRANAEAECALGESQGGAAGWEQGACVASTLAEEELLVALDQGERVRLADIEAALRRLARGRYGLCEGCGRPIPPDRLHAVPWTPRCLDCAGRPEATRLAPVR